MDILQLDSQISSSFQIDCPSSFFGDVVVAGRHGRQQHILLLTIVLMAKVRVFLEAADVLKGPRTIYQCVQYYILLSEFPFELYYYT